MKIKVKDLMEIINILSESLKELPDSEIDLDVNDYFWEILENELYDPLKTPDPENFGLGQISDDWTELRRLKDNKDIPITYDLKRLGNILKCISDKGNIVLF